MMFAPGWREDDDDDAGLPLERPPVRMSSTESVDARDVGQAQGGAVR